MKAKQSILFILAIVCALTFCACQGSSKTDSKEESAKSDKTSSSGVSDSGSIKDDLSSKPVDSDTPLDPTPTPEPTSTEVPKSYETIEDYYGDYVTEDGGSMTFGYDSENDSYRLYNILFNGEYNPSVEFSWVDLSNYIDLFDGYFTADQIKHSSDTFEVEMAYLRGRTASYMYERFSYQVNFNADGSIKVYLLDLTSGVREKATFTKMK